MLGYPLALLSIREVLGLYSGDLFAFPFVLTPRTVVVSIGGVVLVLLASQIPALRQVARTELAAAVRSS